MSLKTQRLKKGYSQSTLAAISGIKLRTIQQYEGGQRCIDGARLNILCTLALALDCKVYDLIEDDNLKIKLKRTV